MKKLFMMAMVGILSLASFALDLTGVPEAKTGMFRQIKGSSLVITNGTEIVEALTNVLANAKEPNTVHTTWSHPGDWRLYWSLIEDPEEVIDIHPSEYVTNDIDGVVYRVDSKTYTYSNKARVYVDYMDQVNIPDFSISSPYIVGGGATLDGDILTSISNGVVNLEAVDSRGRLKKLLVPSYQVQKTVVTTNLIEYLNPNVDAYIDEWKSYVANAEDMGWYYTTEPGVYTNRAWKTFAVPGAWTSMSPGGYHGGNVWPTALSPHVLVTAWHYTWSHWWSGTVTLTNVVSGGTFTIHKKAPWINLRQWGLANGFSEEECAGLGDFAMVVIDQGQVPSELCPYLAWPSDLEDLFGPIYTDLPFWQYRQDPNLWAIPKGVRFYTSEWPPESLVNQISIHDRIHTREDLLELGMSRDWTFWGTKGGDSGRPSYIMWKGQLCYIGKEWGWNFTTDDSIRVVSAFIRAQGDEPKYMQK